MAIRVDGSLLHCATFLNRIADDAGIQKELLAECGRISGIPLTD